MDWALGCQWMGEYIHCGAKLEGGQKGQIWQENVVCLRLEDVKGGMGTKEPLLEISVARQARGGFAYSKRPERQV